MKNRVIRSICNFIIIKKVKNFINLKCIDK